MASQWKRVYAGHATQGRWKTSSISVWGVQLWKKLEAPSAALGPPSSGFWDTQLKVVQFQQITVSCLLLMELVASAATLL